MPFRRKATPVGNPLEAYFRSNRGRLIHKWSHYFDIYDRHFSAFRDREVTLVEFGVWHGGSLQMWKHYLGPTARIVGVDVDPRCAELAEDQIEIVIGDQEDREFLRALRDRLGPLDVVVDDGGHGMRQQINTFEEMFPALRVGGVFLVEDLHTSYWEEYGGGYRRAGTMIEYAKDLIDQLNAWHSKDSQLTVGDYTRTIGGMHVYDSVIVFDKADLYEPHHEQVGTPSF